MLAELKSVRFPVETGILLALCIFLPLAEAPKNLLWGAYLVAWLVNRVRAREFGGRWDAWDTLIGLWIASGYLVAAFAGLHGDEWGGANDLLRYGSILWLVKRAQYSARECAWLLGALAVSVVAGLAIGYFRLWTGIGKSGTLQLHSVGHVNHTAIYIAIMLGACASWLIAYWRVSGAPARALAAAVTLLLLVSLIFTASRGAIGVGLVMLVALAAAWWRAWRAPLLLSLAGIALVIAAGIALRVEVVRKQERNIADQNVLAFRESIWRTSVGAWERYPWFGVGMGNYGLISPALMKQWRAEAGKEYDEKQYIFSTHAHSLYVNALAERGAIGLAALMAALLAWIIGLLRDRPRPGDPPLYWTLWGGAASAWIVSAGVGTANTTLQFVELHACTAASSACCWVSSFQAKPYLAVCASKATAA